MPTYEYKCNACGREFEVQQRMVDDDLVDLGIATLEVDVVLLAGHARPHLRPRIVFRRQRVADLARVFGDAGTGWVLVGRCADRGAGHVEHLGLHRCDRAAGIDLQFLTGHEEYHQKAEIDDNAFDAMKFLAR